MDDSVLASNADRERVVARLRDAHVEGRLTLEELDRLAGAAHTARTVGELERLASQLPSEPRPAPPPAPAAAPQGPYSGLQIFGMVALTLFVPLGRLVGLIVALSLLRDEQLPERRRLLRAWAWVCGVLLVVEVLVILAIVTHI